MGDGRRDPKKRKGERSKRTESNNQLRNTRKKEKKEGRKEGRKKRRKEGRKEGSKVTLANRLVQLSEFTKSDRNIDDVINSLDRNI